MRVDVFDVARVRGGRVVEHWGVPDRLGAAMQLGHIQPPRPAQGSAPAAAG